MNVPPLCILQMRYASTRLPAKMLLTLGDETLAARGWRIACEAFGAEHCVVAIPASDEAGPLGDELRRINARIFAWDGDEADVLGRFHACAHRFRWHPDSVIVRYTPDDWNKNVVALRAVAGGRRLSVEIGGEAFTLAMLDAAVARREQQLAPIFESASRGYMDGRMTGEAARAVRTNAFSEHLTRALFPIAPPPAPPPAPPGCWTIDTEAGLIAARAQLAEQRTHDTAPMVRQ